MLVNFKLNKLNTYAIFGAVFISLILLGNGLYSSNQIFAQQNQTENEAEVKADIEQENKCKKDTECENENKINNQLNIVNNVTQSQQQPESSPCEDCFTSILSQDQIDAFLIAFSNAVEQNILTLEELCQYIDNNQGTEELDRALIGAAASSEVFSEQEYSDLIACLQDAGFDVNNIL